MNIVFSPYIVTWVEFFPDSGIVTKHDQRLFGAIPLRGKSPKTYRKHFRTKEAARKWLESFDPSRLDKSYTCRYFTDKQFEFTTAADGYKIPYTRKQWEDTFRLESGK